jgi:serine/threonine protein kinase
MIPLTCSHCGSKFRVKEEFAERTGRCPTCKQPLTVPRARAADARVPTGKIEGMRSSLLHAGLEVNVTLDTPSGSRSEQRSVADLLAGHARHGNRYTIEGEIARGGMGAVVRAVDCDIRREVAIKYMLDDTDGGKKARFVEEAQITGQLEHPNIVPIHELGLDAEQRLFFAMKMVRGRSLGQILEELREHPDTAKKTWSLGRLLNVFVNVCHALAYAHSRGVIHRDLKPANIMVGDFGEVYVMDWGLAKVLGAEDTKDQPAAETPHSPAATPATTVDDSGSGTHSGSSRVVTSREVDTELTRDGAIMGTPSYMSPEQAQARRLDGRSDIYSLGAILYELLTLQSPISKEGGHLAVLMRVALGEIQPPQQRAPDRTRQGRIPKELAAVAMKALALKPDDRYTTVQSLRRDIERFQEGRSVSAKSDSFREIAWKLVKRNKGASLATGIGLLVSLAVLVVSFQLINAARLRAEDERNNAEIERNKAKEAYQAYLDQVKGSVPVLLRAAKAALGERQFDDALVQASLAVKSAPDNADARLLTGELLITRKRFDEAVSELEEYRKLKGEDAGAQTLTQLCRKAQPETAGSPEETISLLAFADIFTKAQDHALADGVLSSLGLGKNAPEVRQGLLNMYRERIKAAWPGKENNLTMGQEGRFSLGKLGPITDLTPLRGIPLTSLSLAGNLLIRDLMPLKSMPLTSLSLRDCREVRDLAPLEGMPLTTLELHGCIQVHDLAPLKGMPLTSLSLRICTQVRDLEPLKDMKLTTLDLASCPQVRDLGPLKGMPLTTLELSACPEVRDLEPLRGMPLASLSLGCPEVRTLEPLKGMKLTDLKLYACVQRGELLEPLQGMPLTTLVLNGCPLVRIEPLKGMKLTSLDLRSCIHLSNLEPLNDMPLTSLSIWDCRQVRDLEPLKGMPLTSLNVINCSQIRDLEPLKGMPLKTLLIGGAGVTDLKPLQGMQLEDIGLTPKNITQGLDILRNMKSLKTIGFGGPQVWPPAEFWRRYDAGEFSK